MARFLVTGCAGFIGSHLVERLLKDGQEVVGVDNFATGKAENIAPFRDRMRFIFGDLCEKSVAEEACQGVDYVLHQASIPSVPRSLRDPLASLHSTITTTVTLLQAAAAAGVKRVVQAGSSSVYGDSETLPKREDMLPRPLSPYAAAKISQEYYAAAFSRCFGIDTVTLRYFNVFGPRQDPASEYAAVIPKFISLMLAGKSPLIYGDGLQSRDFTYVDNVVEGNLRAAMQPGPLRGEAINLACGDRFTLLELVATINQLLGTDIKPIHGEPRPGDVRHSQADISKAKELLGFTPICSFEEGLRRTLTWYRQKKRDKT